MDGLQELWNNIPESPLEERAIEEVADQKSVLEIDRFIKILRIELYVSLGLIPLLIFFHNILGKEFLLMTLTIVVIGSILNVFTLKSLKKIEFFDNVMLFLQHSIRALKKFVYLYFTSLLIVNVLVLLVFKLLKANQNGWNEWLSSTEGLFVILLLLIINSIIVGYAWVFYIRKIRSLTAVLKDFESNSH